MRIIPSALQAKLDAGATTLCWCWKIIRTDGVILGFTEHDSDLVFDNLTWKAQIGLRPGVIESAVGFSTDNGMAAGALNIAGISADDIDAGKYEQAAIEIWRVDWQDVTLRVGFWSGEIGDITRGEYAFEAEIAGPARKLSRTFGRVFTKVCDAELGDERCTKNVSVEPFLRQSVVTRIIAPSQFAITTLVTPEADWFIFGTAQWLDGANVGQVHRITQYFRNGAEDVVQLAELPAKPVGIGDTVKMVAGCNKSLDHCANKFSNSINFRGCPFMPGNDLIIAGPTPS